MGCGVVGCGVRARAERSQEGQQTGVHNRSNLRVPARAATPLHHRVGPNLRPPSTDLTRVLGLFGVLVDHRNRELRKVAPACVGFGVVGVWQCHVSATCFCARSVLRSLQAGQRRPLPPFSAAAAAPPPQRLAFAPAACYDRSGRVKDAPSPHSLLLPLLPLASQHKRTWQ